MTRQEWDAVHALLRGPDDGEDVRGYDPDLFGLQMDRERRFVGWILLGIVGIGVAAWVLYAR